VLRAVSKSSLPLAERRVRELAAAVAVRFDVSGAGASECFRPRIRDKQYFTAWAPSWAYERVCRTEHV
jgi:hypothetical protein